VLRAGDAGDAGQPGPHRAAELQDQRVRRGGGDRFEVVVAGGVPGADQAAQCPLRLHRPDRVRVGLGRVLIVPQDVRQACLVPGGMFPAVMEVVLVPVGDHHAAEGRQDAEVAEGRQGAGAQEQHRVLPGERAEDVFLLPGGSGPQRGLIESGHLRGGDQCPDQLDHVSGQVRSGAQAGMDEPG